MEIERRTISNFQGWWYPASSLAGIGPLRREERRHKRKRRQERKKVQDRHIFKLTESVTRESRRGDRASSDFMMAWEGSVE